MRVLAKASLGETPYWLTYLVGLGPPPRGQTFPEGGVRVKVWVRASNRRRWPGSAQHTNKTTSKVGHVTSGSLDMGWGGVRFPLCICIQKEGPPRQTGRGGTSKRAGQLKQIEGGATAQIMKTKGGCNDSGQDLLRKSPF